MKMYSIYSCTRNKNISVNNKAIQRSLSHLGFSLNSEFRKHIKAIPPNGLQNTFWLVIIPLLDDVWSRISPQEHSSALMLKVIPEAVNISKWLLLFSWDPLENYFLSFLLASKLGGRPCCTGGIWVSFTTLASINVYSRIVMPLSNTVDIIHNSQTHAHMFNSTCSLMLVFSLKVQSEEIGATIVFISGLNQK